MKIEITEQELNDLIAIRNYFGEHDVTIFEHKAYTVIDNMIKNSNIVISNFRFTDWVDDRFVDEIFQAIDREDAIRIMNDKYPNHVFALMQELS